MENGGRIKNMGLRGVTVADTKISFIDGLKVVVADPLLYAAHSPSSP